MILCISALSNPEFENLDKPTLEGQVCPSAQEFKILVLKWRYKVSCSRMDRDIGFLQNKLWYFSPCISVAFPRFVVEDELVYRDGVVKEMGWLSGENPPFIILRKN